MRWKLPRLATASSKGDTAVDVHAVVDHLSTDRTRCTDGTHCCVRRLLKEGQAMQGLVNLMLNAEQSFGDDCETHRGFPGESGPSCDILVIFKT